MRRRFFLGFVALSVSSFACAAILGIDDPVDRMAADASTSDTSAIEAGGADAESGDGCALPSCEGRCGALTNACGTVQCGTVCDQGRACDESTGQCTCPSFCGESKCGTIANACGELVPCGPACGADESCRPPDGGSVDAGLSCRPGSCTDPPKETVCAGACGSVTTACGTPVTCAGCEATPGDAGICSHSTCSCPKPDRTLRRILKNDVHCERVDDFLPCQGGDDNGVIGRIYSDIGDQDLYRCDLLTRFALSLNCKGSFGGSVHDVVKIGKCLSTPRCGAVPLRQLKNTSVVNPDFYETTDAFDNPAGYQDVGALCYIFPP